MWGPFCEEIKENDKINNTQSLKNNIMSVYISKKIELYIITTIVSDEDYKFIKGNTDKLYDAICNDCKNFVEKDCIWLLKSNFNTIDFVYWLDSELNKYIRTIFKNIKDRYKDII